MALHSHIQGFDASAEYPGIEGRKCRARAPAKKIEIVNQRFFAYHNSSQHTTLSIYPFSCRMDHEVRAILNGSLINGGSEAVVHVQQQVILTGKLTCKFEVNDFQAGK
jgi:hypothetical protein